MEVNVKIPKNTYEVPTEVRTDAVQAICEAFLKTHTDSFNTNQDGLSSIVYKDKRGQWSFCWGMPDRQRIMDTRIYYKPRGCEVKAAFKALENAGYFIFYRLYGANEYYCYIKPYFHGYKRVSEFNDFID